MAFKTSYKIPNSLDKSFLNEEIKLIRSAHAKPLPLKVILFYMVSLLVLFWACSSTFIAKADFGWIALFAVWWILATIYFGRYSKTKELRITGIPALLNYLPKSQRKVLTRRTSNASAFYSIAGIKGITDDGRVSFADGTVGQAYIVVGSASILVFEADKKAIINRVDSFYRKIETTSQFIWITTKEPQRVYRQLANLERRNLALKIREPELFALLEEDTSILTEYVGSRFNSIHQYLLIKADNDEALMRAHSLLQAEVQDSSLMIKNCTLLDGDGSKEVLRGIYAYQA